MINFLHYPLKVTVIFTLLYVVYICFFKRLTFHRLNRVYLITIIPLSLLLPILNLGISTRLSVSSAPYLFNDFGLIERNTAQATSFTPRHLSTVTIIFIAYVLVTSAFVFRLLKSAFLIINIKRQARTKIAGKFSVIQANISEAFSCFNWIYIPSGMNENMAGQIIEHEKIHGKALHTLDLILTELFIAFLWFNPFVYFFRNDLKSIHEYQIDNKLLQSYLKRSEYLQLLLNHLEDPARFTAFCSNMNGSTMEKRIHMITKDKSQQVKRRRYIMIIPLLAFIIMAFSNSTNGDNNMPDIFPFRETDNFKISSRYGDRIHPVTKTSKFHYGIDLTAKEGVPIITTAGGVVSNVGFFENSYGNLVEIDHGNGFITRYAQMSAYAVKKGDKVKQGDIIGYVGKSGRATGPHLHYELIKNGAHINPLDYIVK